MGFFSALGKLVVLSFLGPAIGGVIDGFLGIGMIPAIAAGFVVALALLWKLG